MRVRVCYLVPGVRTRPKPPDTSLGKSRGHAPRRRVATSLCNGVRPPTTRPGQGERHCLIKQRERTEYPQLTDVPSDLRVNGARHASRDSVPPSKPFRPLRGRNAVKTFRQILPPFRVGRSILRLIPPEPMLCAHEQEAQP